MFELSGVPVIEWFLWESISEGSTGIQKQLELLDVRVIGGSSYRKCTVTPEEKKQMRPKFVHISRAYRFPETHKIFI